MSQTSSMEKEQTTAPLLGAISTSPSASSMVRACRIGARLTPSRSASWPSTNRSSGPYSPSRIERRSRSKTQLGPPLFSQSRKVATEAPFPAPLRGRLYTILPECAVRGKPRRAAVSGIFDLREHGPAGDEISFSVWERGDPAGVGRGNRLLHLHRLEHEQELPLLDLVALTDEHLYHRARHRGRQAGACRFPATWPCTIHVGRLRFREPVGYAAQGDEHVRAVEGESGRDGLAVHGGVYAAVVLGEDLYHRLPAVEPQDQAATRTSGFDHVLLLPRRVAEPRRPQVAPGTGRERLVVGVQRELGRRRVQHRLARNGGVRWCTTQIVLFEKADRGLPGGEGRVSGDAAQQREVGRDAEDGVVPEGPAQPPDRRVPVRRVDDQLREHGVVVERDLVAGLDAGVAADAGSLGRVEGEESAAGGQAVVFGVEAHLYGAAAQGDVLLGEGQGLSGGDGQLEVDEV